MDSIKLQVSKILKIDISDSWDVYDTYKSLCIVNHNKNVDMKKFGYLKSYIVDIESSKIIPSYFPTKKLFLDEINENNALYNPYKGYTISYGIEGEYLRALKYKDELLICSKKKINDIRYDFIKQDINVDNVDNEDCDYYIYMDKDTLISSKYLVANTEKDYSLFYCKSLIQNKNFNQGKPYRTIELQNTITSLSSLTIEEANKYLRYGHNSKFFIETNDRRLNFGEFLFLHNNNEIIEVYSHPYNWRRNIAFSTYKHDDYLNFMSNLNYSYIKTNTKEGLTNYCKHLPIIKPINLSMIGKDEIIIWKSDISNVQLTKSKNLQNIFYAYLASISIYKQFKNSYFLDKFINDRKKAFYNLKLIVDLNKSVVSGTIKFIIKNSINNAVITFNQKDNNKSLTSLIYYNMKYNIYNMDGKHLYKVFIDLNI